MNEQALSAKDISALKTKGLLEEGETAVSVGDTIVAINVVTRSRRHVNTSGVLLESSRRLLKD